MSQVHMVKKARKNYPEAKIKKGDTYYWWATRTTVGRAYVKHLHRSLTSPTMSQMTSSDYLRAIYEVQEVRWPSDSSLEGMVEEAANDLEAIAEEQDEHFNNMPEGLQQGETGQLLEARRDECQEAADALRSVEPIDVDEQAIRDDNPIEDGESGADWDDRISDLVEEAWKEIIQEVEDALSNLGSAG
jgi:hypothetical protein